MSLKTHRVGSTGDLSGCFFPRTFARAPSSSPWAPQLARRIFMCAGRSRGTTFAICTAC